MQLGSRRIAGLLGATALAALLVAAAAPSARASVITTDPLHGFCNGSAPGGTCNDNGTNTPLGNSTSFGFTVSPGPQTGDLELVVLSPNNLAAPGSFSITGTGTNPSGTANLVAGPAWTTGFLDAYLGLSASPANGIGAYLPTTQQYQSAATGFNVYTVTFDNLTIPANGSTQPSWDVLSGLGNGGYVVGILAVSTTKHGTTTTSYIATANSGALLVDGAKPPVPVPEPGSLAILGTALGALGLGLTFRRRRRA